MRLLVIAVALSAIMAAVPGLVKASAPMYGVGLNIAPPSLPDANGNLTFTYTVSNTGRAPLHGVVLSFTANVRPVERVHVHLVFGPAGRALQWRIGTIPGGQSRSIAITIDGPRKHSANVCVGGRLTTSIKRLSALKVYGACIQT